jgi:hypothetical protein
MAFTRFNYDECRTKKLLQESTDPGRWVMNVPGNGLSLPFVEDPHIRMQRWGANLMADPVDIASDLDGRTRRLTKACFKHQYPLEGVVTAHRPALRSTLVSAVQSVNPLLSHDQYSSSGFYDAYPTQKAYTEETRASHPAWMYRDLEQVRWEYPLLDPQENTCMPFHANLSTRILEKDAFVPKVPHGY